MSRRATPADHTLIQRQICATGQATGGAIDAQVYELYGLTEEEIGIVEGATQIQRRTSWAPPLAALGEQP